ncbi:MULTISPECIES: FtsX-like permease family protein [Corynebacterium]|uniref:FtsX-like permease family protein n=1 Tax=Corynebacterium TaxID=1716 RepID=UPI0027E39DA7|nr:MULTISPECIES: FtsX-like permease family protein [Corynebacterium]
MAIVAALTIYSAMSVITRSRETKLVRAIGGSSIGILAAAVVEATVLGLLGAALGLPLGVALAGAAPAVTEEMGILVPLDNVGLPATWLAAIGAGALAVTVLSALPAAVLSVRRSAVESAEASGSRALQAGYVVVAIVFAGAAFALRGGGVIRAVASAGLATLSAAAALSVIIPLLLRVRVTLPPLGLALGYTSRQWNRSASVIGIVTVAVALVAAVLTGSEQPRSHFVDAASKQGLVDATVTSLPGDIAPTLADAQAATPGVAASLVPPRVPEGFAVDPGSPVLRRGVQSGVVSLAKGSTVDTELPTVKTSNLFTVVDPALVADTVDAAPRPTVMLRMEGALVQDPAMLDGVRAAAAGADAPVTMTESFSRRADTVAMVERLLSITWMMSLIALVIALVGIANTVFLSWRERRRDRALLITLGQTPLGSVGVMAVELLFLVLPAAGAGWLVGEWAGEFIAAIAVG